MLTETITLEEAWKAAADSLGIEADFDECYIGEIDQPSAKSSDRDDDPPCDVEIIQKAMHDRWKEDANQICESVPADWKDRLVETVISDLEEEEDYDRYFWIGNDLFRIPDKYEPRDCEPFEDELYDDLDILTVYIRLAP